MEHGNIQLNSSYMCRTRMPMKQSSMGIEEFTTLKKTNPIEPEIFFLPLSPPNCSSPRSTAVNEKE